MCEGWCTCVPAVRGCVGLTVDGVIIVKTRQNKETIEKHFVLNVRLFLE